MNNKGRTAKELLGRAKSVERTKPPAGTIIGQGNTINFIHYQPAVNRRFLREEREAPPPVYGPDPMAYEFLPGQDQRILVAEARAELQRQLDEMRERIAREAEERLQGVIIEEE